MKRHALIQAAAAVALAGMDPMRFLTSEDQVEVIAMSAIADVVHEARAEANS